MSLSSSFLSAAAKRLALVGLTVLPVWLGHAWAASSAAPKPASFAWTASTTVPPGAAVGQFSLPAEALLRMQSPQAADVCVFNAAQEPVAYARIGNTLQAAQPQHTASYPAYALHSESAGGAAGQGAIELEVDSTTTGGTAGTTRAWVRLTPSGAQASAPKGRAVQATLFDLRLEKKPLSALQLSAQLPANTLVHFSAASSTDLQHWTPLPLKGPLFRFEGPDAPSSHTLELQAPTSLEGRYVRLGWAGFDGVHVTSLEGVVAQDALAPARVVASLGAGSVEAGQAQTWQLPFALPIAALHLEAARDNTLLPLRIAGRADASQPWRALGQTVVYRLNHAGQTITNPAVVVDTSGMRWLRIEALNGLPLPEAGLQARVEFAPLRFAFLATGAGPFTVAVGRADTPPAAVDASLLGSVLPASLDSLPQLTLTPVRADVAAPTPAWAAGWLPEGVPLRSVLLWAVLVLGVLALAAVAWRLLHQLKQSPSQGD